MKAVKLSDLERIIEEGIKIRHVGWDDAEYTYYNSYNNEWSAPPHILEIQNGNFVFYEEKPEKIVPRWYMCKKDIITEFHEPAGVHNYASHCRGDIITTTREADMYPMEYWQEIIPTTKIEFEVRK